MADQSAVWPWPPGQERSSVRECPRWRQQLYVLAESALCNFHLIHKDLSRSFQIGMLCPVINGNLLFLKCGGAYDPGYEAAMVGGICRRFERQPINAFRFGKPESLT